MSQQIRSTFVVSEPSEIVRALVGLKDVRVLCYARRGPEVELVVEQVVSDPRCPGCRGAARVKERPLVRYVDLPVFGTPAWVLQTLIVLLALGFVPALVFSWVFELTPDGLKRDRDVPAEASIGAQTARKMDRMLVVGMVVVVALIAADRLWPGTPAPAVAAAPSGAQASGESPVAPEGAPAGTAPANSPGDR